MQFDIRRFDIYRKVPKDLTQPTFTGACISILSVVFMLSLFLSELAGFLQVEVVSELIVDDPVKHSEKIPVFLNITLARCKCEYLGLDIQDDMGRHEVGFKDNTEKFPTDEGEGCRMETHFLINKEVKGSFNPMENLDKLGGNSMATHDYIVRVVPSVYINIKAQKRFPYQYTYSYRELLQYGHGGHTMPAIWFRYELSPITVQYTERRIPFYHFLTMVCAIVGGTFTVAGIFDSCVFTAYEIIKKAELGKLS